MGIIKGVSSRRRRREGMQRTLTAKCLVLLNIVFKFISGFTRAMTQVQLQTAEMADIPSLSVRLRRRLSVPAGIEDLSDAEGILLL